MVTKNYIKEIKCQCGLSFIRDKNDNDNDLLSIFSIHIANVHISINRKKIINL